MAGFSGFLLRLFGWKVDITVPDYPKCIICVAPHTSNWDFILGKLAYVSVGRKAGFLMKDTWFFWPLGPIFRSIGGIAVPRRRKADRPLTEVLTEMFRASQRMAVAITPEGTRSRTAEWHTGFLHIAAAADVPVVLGVIDYEHKMIFIRDTFEPSGDISADLRAVKNYYSPYKGKYPDKFTTE